jgi:osmotically-inducible protein OsmY
VLVDTRDVTVRVEHGVVTLNGSVPTWAARRTAENDASIAAGVVKVHNDLTITG